jgi:Short C-terminal domain
MSRKQIIINTMPMLAIVLFLAGCGTTVQTMSHEDAVKARTNGALTSKINEDPVYDMPLAEAWPVVRETLSSFCDGRLKTIDEENHYLEGVNRNFWNGDALVMVGLKPDHQQTIVQIAVRDYGFNRDLVTSRSPHIFDLFLKRLNEAMMKKQLLQPNAATRLKTLNDLKAKGLINEDEYREKRAAILNGL